nr:hypothetical protein Itr_chr02CG15180 [Ipomoea trifida]
MCNICCRIIRFINNKLIKNSSCNIFASNDSLTARSSRNRSLRYWKDSWKSMQICCIYTFVPSSNVACSKTTNKPPTQTRGRQYYPANKRKQLLPPREAPELQCCLAVGTSLLSGSLNCRPAKRSLQIYGSTREGAQIYGSTAKAPISTDLPRRRPDLRIYREGAGRPWSPTGLEVSGSPHLRLLNPRKRKIKPKTATDKGDGSSTAVPNDVPTQTGPIQRQPNPRVRRQKQTCGTQPTVRQSKLIPRKRKINQTTLNESVGGSNPVVPLGIVVTVGPVNALKQLVL